MRLAILLTAALLAGDPAGTLRLTSFENDAEVALASPRDARKTVVSRGVTDGSRAVEVEYSTAAWPSLLFVPAVPWDFSSYGELAIDVTNPGGEAVAFYVRVDDGYRPDGVGVSRTGSGTIEAGGTATYVFPLAAPATSQYNMRGFPAWPGSRSLGSGGDHLLNLKRITQFQIFMASPAKTTTLIFDNVRARPSPPLAGIVDEFGQYTDAEWPGKLARAGDWAGRRADEEAELGARRELPGRDIYGAWAGGPLLSGTGFFRVEQVNGKWWMVSPFGTLFFSAGMDTMIQGEQTIVEGREETFQWLPAKDDALARYYGSYNQYNGPWRRTYDFRGANLERKYGANWRERWRDTGLDRLRSWGFNTIANWSDVSLHRNGIPYVTTTHIWGSYNILPAGASGTGWMHDPFDPNFPAAVADRLRETLTPAASDPWCVGHFVDNELEWGWMWDDTSRYGIPLGVLTQGSASPAKKALMAMLQTRYASVAALNGAWGTNYSSWGAVGKFTGTFNAAVKNDLGEFLRRLAREYFRVVREEMRKIDPNHLYLGSRFSSYSPEVVSAAAEFVDVISFNIYQPRIDAAAWAWLNDTGRPAIIGEFHFGALDRGMFHPGLVAAPDQAGRAAMYRSYMESALAHPALVGAHWFEYADEPLTGRALDGENYNIGFVSVTDTPYPEMVEAARNVHREMYRKRYGERPAGARQ